MTNETRVEERDKLRIILRKAEIKRVAERLTKKELCTLFDLNYNFYMNCVSDRNIPSEKMQVSLIKYLETPTVDVYRMVFSKRIEEAEHHEKLYIDEKLVKEITKELTDNGYLTEPIA